MKSALWEPCTEPVLIVSCVVEREDQRGAAHALFQRYGAIVDALGVYEVRNISDDQVRELTDELGVIVAVGGGTVAGWHYDGHQFHRITPSEP